MACFFAFHNRTQGLTTAPDSSLSLRERARERVIGPGVICASQDCKFGINISRARPTVVEIDPGDSLPDRGENESGIVATVNGLAGFFVQR